MGYGFTTVHLPKAVKKVAKMSPTDGKETDRERERERVSERESETERERGRERSGLNGLGKLDGLELSLFLGHSCSTFFTVLGKSTVLNPWAMQQRMLKRRTMACHPTKSGENPKRILSP